MLVLPVDHDEVFELGGSGVALWEVLAEPRTLGQAACTLAARFAESPSQVESDLAPVLAELVRRGAVVELGDE